jgi:rRNA maturation RNase YbeY
MLRACIAKHGRATGDINLILVSDEQLLTMNRDYLQHDYYTDILTFDYSDEKNVSGDLFISAQRVNENAQTHGVTFQDELRRVALHGVLHLVGYKDKTAAEKKTMRQTEDQWLSSLS